VATLGFRGEDFKVFEVEGFNERMEQIYERIRPRLMRLGEELAPELARRMHMEFFAHTAKHARRTVNPPPETWVAFGPSARGYKRYGYLALCISRAGLHARLVVKSEADRRTDMAALIRDRAPELAAAIAPTALALYDKWDFRSLPKEESPKPELFVDLAGALAKKTGGIDVGFGWSRGSATSLERAELLDAFVELEPLYRIVRSVG
jgi:uncharacterized protein YktB (UPF0637 family)